MSKSEIWSLKLWFTTLKELNKCFGCSKTCKCAYWLYFIDSIGLRVFRIHESERQALFELCIRKYLFLAIRRSLNETLPGYTFTSSIFALFWNSKTIRWVSDYTESSKKWFFHQLQSLHFVSKFCQIQVVIFILDEVSGKNIDLWIFLRTHVVMSKYFRNQNYYFANFFVPS